MLGLGLIRNKLLWAGIFLAAFLLLGARTEADAAQLARWIIGALALLGLIFWARTRGTAALVLPQEKPLEIVSRAGLSGRCGVSLVKAHGRSFLVIHGDGFAKVTALPSQGEGRS